MIRPIRSLGDLRLQMIPTFLLFLIILSLVSPITLVLAKNMTVGDILSTSDPPLLSYPSGDFSFGFHRLTNSNGSSSEETFYLLSIWYTKIPQTTIVWYAGEDGIIAPHGSKLNLSSTDGLLLTDPQQGAQQVIWNSTLDNDGVVHHCSLSDAGNLVLWDSRGQPMWQSFKDQRDTLLPTQTIRGDEANPKNEVFSRRKENNFTRGRFLMRFDSMGVFQLITRNPNTNQIYDGHSLTVIYYSNSTYSGHTLSFDTSGHMYVLNVSGARVKELTPADNVPGPEKDYYFRATLNFDGVFTWYYYLKNSSTNNSSGENLNDSGSSWQPMTKSIPDNICTSILGPVDSGACGLNSICSIGSNHRPKCECPPHYSLVDPNDPYGDCHPNFETSACGKQPTINNLYRFESMAQVDWPSSDYDGKVNVDENYCKSWCMNDCFCAAFVIKDRICWKKNLPLSNGRRDENGGTTAFLKFKDDTIDIPFASGHMDRRSVRIRAMLGTLAGANILLFGLIIGMVIWFFQFYRGGHLKGGANYSSGNKQHPSSKFYTVCRFTYRELQEATEGFKQELGRGACAIVYKGNLPERYPSSSGTGSHQALIAVKKIDRASMGDADKEFRAEVNIIGQTHHRNLVRLIGYCEEEENRLLVYEYMSNGSLAKILFGEQMRPSWDVRSNIAKGIATGILYLHEECSTQIIHCDIKPQNILLDESYHAKISDFGLSKLLKLNQFHTRTVVRGTKGYVAPEWFRSKMINAKVDVYSFGVLLLEIVSCRRSIDFLSRDEERAVLTDFAINCYECGDWASLIGDDREALLEMQVVERFLKVAIWCIQEDPNLRPTMRQVTLMLEGVVEVPMPPLPLPDSSSFSATTQSSLSLRNLSPDVNPTMIEGPTQAP